MKVTIIDSVSAWVMEQQIYDAQGRLRARSVVENYRRDPRTGLYVPTAVQVECPASQFSMRVDLGTCKSTSCRAIRPSCGPCPAILIRRWSTLAIRTCPLVRRRECRRASSYRLLWT